MDKNNRISEIRERCDAASTGPWVKQLYNEDYGQGYGETTFFIDVGFNLLKIGIADSQEKAERLNADTEFIARARTDILYLLDRLANAEAEVGRMREAQRWVSVSEKMPTKKDADEYGFILAGHLYDDGTMVKYACMWNLIEDNVKLGNINHWMKLPKTPKGLKENDRSYITTKGKVDA